MVDQRVLTQNVLDTLIFQEQEGICSNAFQAMKNIDLNQ